MAVHPLKKLAAIVGLAAGLACLQVSYGHAFTETKITPPPNSEKKDPNSPEPPKLQIEKSEDGGLSLTTPSNDASGETELTIPGVGSIGKVPKLDFGLELLYGGPNSGTDSPGDEQKDDVLIKGKIRHRF